MATHRSQYNTEVMMIFKSTNSLIRCIVDCQKCSGDSVSTIAALMLERSLGSRAWDDSPLQLRQVPGIGTVATRKLVNAQIRSIEDLEATDAQRIETLIGRNPPFGLEILEALKSFPKLRVSLHVQPSSVRYRPNYSIRHSPCCRSSSFKTESKFNSRLRLALLMRKRQHSLPESLSMFAY
jgi:ATP-dependent DNA helicase HFM1/MER3